MKSRCLTLLLELEPHRRPGRDLRLGGDGGERDQVAERRIVQGTPAGPVVSLALLALVLRRRRRR